MTLHKRAEWRIVSNNFSLLSHCLLENDNTHAAEVISIYGSWFNRPVEIKYEWLMEWYTHSLGLIIHQAAHLVGRRPI